MVKNALGSTHPEATLKAALEHGKIWLDITQWLSLFFRVLLVLSSYIFISKTKCFT